MPDAADYGIEIVREPIELAHVRNLAESLFGDLVKAVVDVERGIMAIGGELHADEEAVLLDDGGRQEDLWGINLYPDSVGQRDFVEFDSMINVRPRLLNNSRSVEDGAGIGFWQSSQGLCGHDCHGPPPPRGRPLEQPHPHGAAREHRQRGWPRPPGAG